MLWNEQPKKVIVLYVKGVNESWSVFLSKSGLVKSRLNLGRLCSKAKYFW